MSHANDKREFSRIRVSFPVSIELPNQKLAEGNAVNIGQGGMLISCSSGNIFSKLDDVNLYLPFNHNQNKYAIAAKVTRIQGNNIGLFFYSDPTEYLQEALSDITTN